MSYLPSMDGLRDELTCAQQFATTADGMKIAFSLEGEGPPLVLIMGYRLNSRAWPREFVEALAARWTVVLIDNRGTGSSDKPVNGYALANMARDVASVLDAAGISRAHVLGYSMGGAIAQEFVDQFPDRVNGLVLCATLCGGEKAVYANPSVLKVMRDLEGLSPDEAARRIWTVTYAPSYLRDNRSRVEEQMRREIDDPTPLHAADLQFQALASVDTSAGLKNVRSPTLILTGDLDQLVPAENAAILARFIPDTTLQVFKGAGHRLLWERSDDCARLISGFLSRVETQAEGERRGSEHASVAAVALSASTQLGGLPGRLAHAPYLLGDLAVRLAVSSAWSFYFGRRPRFGNGKPVLVLSDSFHAAESIPVAYWLGAVGYRPVRPSAQPGHSDRTEEGISHALATSVRRIGRKAAIVALDGSMSTAIRIACSHPQYISDVIGIGSPVPDTSVPEGVRRHLITSGRRGIQTPGITVHEVYDWPWLMGPSPAMLIALSDVLAESEIELVRIDT